MNSQRVVEILIIVILMMSEAVHDVADNSEEFFSAESDTEVSGEREDSQQHEPMTKGSDNGREVDRIQSVNGSKSEPSHAGVPNEDSGANVVQEDSEKDLSAEEIQVYMVMNSKAATAFKLSLLGLGLVQRLEH